MQTPPLTDPSQIDPHDWLIKWDGRTLHARQNVTSKDIHELLARLEHLAQHIHGLETGKIQRVGQLIIPLGS